ncbi:hypothetical protein [Pseudomonas sp. PIC25]|uniref:hypothetical protein n=1 Tax=Pseudomonas sp. PIC25 TaxID=1958773 RepID=UPI00117B2153|nr:hypothetical protein [Pseudomonas sp. PIC25]
MKKIIEDLRGNLSELKDKLHEKSLPETLISEEVGVTGPALTRFDIAWRIELLIDKLKANEDVLMSQKEDDSLLGILVDRTKYLLERSIPYLFHGSSSTAQSLITSIEDVEFTVNEELRRCQGDILGSRETLSRDLQRVTVQVRAMESRLKALAPRSENIESLVGRIESAGEAADKLPTDLESLEEARAKINEALIEVEANKRLVEKSKSDAEKIADVMKACSEDAAAVLERCETAYASATSQGLAAAFQERSVLLNKSIKSWVAGLAVALIVGGVFGSQQIAKLSETINGNSNSTEVIIINLVLAVLSVGAPIWFAWISTKQIGDRFKLSEDYAFKASISRAYEGYRREAARLDKDLELSLLSSALNRLDELPLRLVDPKSHGSPWHELLSSEAIKEAVKTVPGFVSNVGKLANSALEKLAAADQRPRKHREEQSTAPKSEQGGGD